MKLQWHLSLSHLGPVVIVTLALGGTLFAMARLSLLLSTLTTGELGVLAEEGELHRRAWALDVSMRHAGVACRAGDAPQAVLQRVTPFADALKELLRGATTGPMTSIAADYAKVADELSQSDPCEALLGGPVEQRRAELDEQLTNVWVARLRELHGAVAEKDEHARLIAVRAIWTGVPLALLVIGLATFIASRTARLVTVPIATIADSARSIGAGGLDSPVVVEGPTEVVALASALETMRLQLRELDGLKEGFVASVSHELRTPLSKIREALALLEDGAVGDIDERQRRVVHIARAACEQEIRLVTTLLDLSRLRAGGPLRIVDGVNLDNVVQAAAEDEKDDAQRRGVELVVKVSQESSSLHLDPVLMERAIANLIRNAVSVSTRGQRVLIRCETSVDAKGGPIHSVTVVDEGPGVPLELRETIFKPFVSHAVTKAGRSLGTGLGLALAREIVRAHGGELSLVEQDRPGAMFALTLPAAVSRDGERDRHDDDVAHSTSTGRQVV
jgi:two-component system sensor histidine kinase GlrK